MTDEARKGGVELSDSLSEIEIAALRCAAGEDVPGLSWGAAISEALESLKARGLFGAPLVTFTFGGSRAYVLTEAGRRMLREKPHD